MSVEVPGPQKRVGDAPVGEGPEAGQAQRALGWERVKDYFSPSGSFSRGQLLIATLVLGGVLFGLSRFAALRPESWVGENRSSVFLGVYAIWGLALGKRARDLGLTFTYGFIVGLLFPFVGIAFLFQRGKEGRRHEVCDGSR